MKIVETAAERVRTAAIGQGLGHGLDFHDRRIADHLQRDPHVAAFLGEGRRFFHIINRKFRVRGPFRDRGQVAHAAERDQLHGLHGAVIGDGVGHSFRTSARRPGG